MAFVKAISLDKAGRVVLPKDLRDKLRLEAGDELMVEEAGEQIIVRTGRRIICSPASSTMSSSPASRRNLSRRSFGRTTRPALSSDMAFTNAIPQWKMASVNGEWP